MIKKNIIRVISFFLLANAFLPLVMKNLPSPLNSTFFWMGAWIGIIILLNVKTLFDLKLTVIFLNLILFYVLSLGNHSNSYLANRYLRDIVDILIACTLLLYFKQKDIKGLALLLSAIFIFIIISSLSSIIGFNMFPNSIRFNSSLDIFGMEEFYKKRGIQGYDFFYGLAFASPVIFYKLKKYYKSSKVISIASFIIFFVSIIKSNYVTAFLFTSAGLFFVLIGSENIKRNKKIVLIVTLLLMIIPQTFYIGLLDSINNLISPESVMSTRLTDLTLTLEGSNETHAEMRISRIPYLLNEISKNPLTGGGDSTGHVFWLDLFSLFGLFTFVSFGLIFYIFFKNNFKFLPDHYKYFYILSYIFFIANGFIKSSGGAIVYYSVFLIIPGFGLIEKYEQISRKSGEAYVQK